MVEVRLGGGALPNPSGGYGVLPADGGGHGPADRLGKLGGQIARNGEDVAPRPVVHHRHLPPLAHVLGVGEALAHQLRGAAAARQVQPLVAVGGKQHIPRSQPHGGPHGHRLLSLGLHIEGYSALPLHSQHVLVKGAGDRHVAQRNMQILVVEVGMPRPHGGVLLVKHPHHPLGEADQVPNLAVDFRALNLPGR